MGLARVAWSMGQTLLPKHLQQLEFSLLTNDVQYFNLHGLPSYGLAELRWNDTLLSGGVLSLDAAKLVTLSGGFLLCLGDNARCEPINLNIADSILVTVYLHVINPSESSFENKARDLTQQQNEVTCWLWPLSLSVEQNLSGSIECMRLADFEKQPDGAWVLADRYVPPLLQIGTTPFFRAELAELAQQLEAYQYQLVQESSALYLSGENLINAKLCIKSAIKLQRFLVNIQQQIHPHPYFVYEELKSFYIDLCYYHHNTPQFEKDPYQHDNLAVCFSRILQPLKEQLQLSNTRSPYLPFNQIEGVIQAKLTSAMREATEAYLLVQKDKVTREINIAGIKIAATSRIQLVHKFSLQGIPLKRVDKPTFQHSFGPEVDIYQLGMGEEWDYALNELAIGFYAEPSCADVKFFLYWRSLK